MTTASMEKLRRQNEGLRTRSQKAVAALARAFNPETLQRLTALFASDIGAPAIRRQGKRHILTRENPQDVIACAVGQRVRAARERKNWRQEDLAGESGLARANVARLETGRVMPKLPTLERVARALGLRTGDLLKTPDSARDQEGSFLADSGMDEWGDQLEAEDKAR